MKSGILLAFVFFTVSAVNAQTAETETVVIKSSIVCSHCLECGTCGELLDEAVLDLAGVKNMEINTTENTITVYYKPEKISVEEIKKAIVAVGYDADDMKAEKAAYEQLDGCCKSPDQH